jgi:hypothetical protein
VQAASAAVVVAQAEFAASAVVELVAARAESPAGAVVLAAAGAEAIAGASLGAEYQPKQRVEKAHPLPLP